MADHTPSPAAAGATSEEADSHHQRVGLDTRAAEGLGGTAVALRRLSAAAEQVSQRLDADRQFTVDEAIEAAAGALATVCQLLKVVMPCVRGDEDLHCERVSMNRPKERPSHEITLHVPAHAAEITVRL